ncbi:MAG TPA: hypothetical protein VGG39_07050 [Polyangiaceae bacterium]|jgi:hypothetical protein
MTRGTLVGIAAGGAGIVVVLVLGAVFAGRACGGSAPVVAVTVAAGNATVAAEGMRAKGTDELRALGCDPPIVVDMARLLGDASRIEPGEPRFMVTCDLGASAATIPCDRVAVTYFRAIGGTAEYPVGVRILRAGGVTPLCSELYAPNGADLGTFPRAP